MSSQSLIHKPEAPVAPFDLNIFSKVLLFKQAKFDAGVDQVQNKISQLESQQVLGDAQKQYLSNKINTMIQGVNGMGGMDFSERNVINQTSSYIDSIAADPIITNAISNTRNIQKGVSFFDKLKQDAAAGKKGVYYNPANEYDYMENVNDYLRRSKTDPTAVYNDKPIAPPVDVNKQLMAAAKDVVASTYTTRDGENRYILKNGKIVTPERLYESAMAQIQTDPAMANQIRVNAKYNYLQRDANGNLSESQLTNLRQTYLKSNENKIIGLQDEITELAKLKAATGDKDAQLSIQQNIDEKAAQLTNYVNNQTNREVEIDTILATNPEAAAANVYTNRLLEGIVAARAFREENVKFDNAAMFVDKMNMEQAKFVFDKEMAEKKFALDQAELALEATKVNAAIEKDKAGVTNASGGLYSEEVSLPTNARKSSQETQLDQIRGVDMQKANVMQDYYHYVYQFKNGQGLIEKDGNSYRPTAKGQSLWEDNMKILKDMRDGRSVPTTLDPEFIKQANKHQDLELVRKQYQNTMVDVNREALQAKRKELGLSDADYELFLKGKTLVEQLPDVFVNAIVPAGTPRITTKDYAKLPGDPESQKAFEIFKKYNPQMKPDNEVLERFYQARGTQIIPRTYTPVGLKESDLKARASALKGQIFSRGYYSLDASQKPEKTARQDIPQEDVKYIGDTYIDLGEGLRPYVKAEISQGTGKEKTTQTVYVDVDASYIGNFRNFAQNVNEAAKQQVLREGSLDYNSASSDGRNIIQTRVVKNGRGVDDEMAAVQIYLTHDSQGRKISPTPITINSTQNMNIGQAVEYAKTFAEKYSQFYKKVLQQTGKKLTPSAFIDELNKQ